MTRPVTTLFLSPINTPVVYVKPAEYNKNHKENTTNILKET
jgi:hypothetical protein